MSDIRNVVTYTLVLAADANAVLDELNARLAGFSELSELPDEAREIMSGLLEPCAQYLEVHPAAAAHDVLVVQLTEPFHQLLAALRALDRDGEVGRIAHAASPSVVGTSMVAEPVPGVEPGAGAARAAGGTL